MKKILFVAVCSLLVCASCVSKKKYLLAENGRLEGLERERILNQELSTANASIESLSTRFNALLRDTAEMGKEIRYYRHTLYSNLSEKEKLNTLLQDKMKQLDQRERMINDLQEMINAQNDKVQALLSSVQDALLGFNDDELSVTMKDGKVYVAMSDKLLFQSGSATVDTRGKEALSKLAQVLNRQNDIDVFIEGHTDTKPIHTAQFKDNWDLSVIRATSVVRILTENYKVNPLQIQPSGRGEYMPVADNESVEGRAKNRRTEIIMAPKLDKLYKMLQ